MNNWPSSDGKKKPIGSMTFLNKASLGMKSFYEIGLQSWIRKQINANTLNRELVSTTISLVNKRKSYSQKESTPTHLTGNKASLGMKSFYEDWMRESRWIYGL
uniref:Uncharacterized protein n=1 Tax=Arundo donax TaxID=35708 RepID=A0A0A9H166_ARUDO